MMTQPGDPREAKEFFVSRYLDGTLDADESREFSARLESDPELAALLAEYRAVDNGVRDWANAEPAVDYSPFASQVRRRIGRDDAVRGRGRLILRLFMPLAAAASIVFTVSLLRENVTPLPPGAGTSGDAWLVQYSAPPEVHESEYVAAVSYSVRPGDVDVAAEEPRGSTPVLAVAAVGPDVGWPEWNMSVGVH